MICCILLFGPGHGKMMMTDSIPKSDLVIMDPRSPEARFQEYRFGEPFGLPRTSMLNKRHYYSLHDIIENDVEEVALYIHSENCCEKDYSHSEEWKQQCKPPEPLEFRDNVDDIFKNKKKGTE